MAPPPKSSLEFLANETTSGDQLHSSVAALGDGRFIVAWIDESQSGGDISGRAVRAQIINGNGTPSGGEILVNNTVTGAQAYPSVAAFADGRFVVTWSDDSRSADDPSGQAVRAQIFNLNGSKAGVEILVNTTTTGNQFTPTIATLADDRFVIAWSDNSQSGADVSGTAIRAQVFDPDGSVTGGEFLVNTATNAIQVGASVTGLADGRFVIAWSDSSTAFGDSSDTAIRAQMYNVDGTRQGGEFLVNTITSNRQYDPDITALAGGGFVVTWMDESQSAGDSSGRAVRAQVFNADGSQSGVEFLVNTTTPDWQYDPAVTGLADGRFVIAWSDLSETSGDTSRFAVRAQVFNVDGTKAGAEFVANSTTAAWQYDPSITVLADGRFVINWTDTSALASDLSGAAIRGQIFDPRVAAVVFAGTGFDDDFTGTRFADDLSGSTGDDSLSGGDGKDRIAGNDGDDVLQGGKGKDILYGNSGDDLLVGGTGADRIFGGDGKDVLRGGDGRDDLFGGDGDDSIQGDAGKDRLSGSTGNDTLMGGDGKDQLNGGDGDDILFGDDGNDQIFGGLGNDTLKGGPGKDTLRGDGGDDTYVVVSKNDTVIEEAGGGVDLVRSATINLRLADFDNIENLRLTGMRDLNLTGNLNANELTGNKGANTLRGDGGNDVIVGNSGDDSLFGGAGADSLRAGLGDDTMTGGTQADRFIFARVAETGVLDTTRDLIRDFNQGEGDMIDFAGIDASSGTPGNQQFQFIGAAAFSSTKGELRYTQQGAITIVQGDTDGDGVADFEIALSGLHTLVAGDFML